MSTSTVRSPGRRRTDVLVWEQTSELTLVTTASGVVTECGPSMGRLVGLEPPEVLDRSILELVDASERARAEAFLDECRDRPGQPTRGEFRTRPACRWSVVEVVGVNRLDHPVLGGLVFTASDVTHRRAAMDALLQSQQHLRRQGERMRLLLAHVPAVLWTTDRELRFTSASGAALVPLGLVAEDVVGRTFGDVLGTSDPAHPALVAHRRALVDGEEADFEFVWRGQVFQGHVRPLELPGESKGVIGLALDVTDRMAVELELRESEAHLIALFENTSDPICALDRDSRLLTFNDPFAELFRGLAGHRPIVGESARESISEAERPFWNGAFARALGGERFSTTLERSLDGAARFFDLSFNPILERGRPIGVSIFGREVTQSRRAERETSELRRRLVEGLVQAQEEERTRIARELHDGCGQSLASLSLGLKMLEGSEVPAAVRGDVATLRRIAFEVSTEVGRIARGLHPGVLDDLGLVAALRKVASEASAAMGLQVDVQVDGLANERLPYPVEIGLYRITQEALTNVMKHASASAVDILLFRKEDAVSLLVEDDGVGFDEGVLASPKGLGILGIRERASMLGGTVSFESSPGSGTTVFVRVPLDGAAT